MKTMTFRFTTEAEVTLQGDCFEDLYMQFKGFMHHESNALTDAQINIMPPEDSHMFVSLDDEPLFEIKAVKGDFLRDIQANLKAAGRSNDIITTSQH